MKKKLASSNIIMFLIILISAGFLSGCNTNGGDLFTQALNSNIPVTDSNDSNKISDAPVKVVNINGYGNVLTTKRSMPLYIKAEDTDTISTCYEECAIAWPPLIVDDLSDVSGDYGTLERTDGKLQVTRLGKPLYSYTPDKVRKVTGDGYRGVWSVVIIESDVSDLE